MFIFRFILFLVGPTCANIPLPSISSVVITVSAQNGSMSCQTHALHCMLISHILFTVLKFRACVIVRVLWTPLFRLIMVMKEWGGGVGGSNLMSPSMVLFLICSAY